MPAGYSWLRNTTSESAAQGVQDAWLARFGFLVFGSTAVLISARMRRYWPLGAGLAHASLGALMIATSAFSTRPWLPEMPFYSLEDALHCFTVTATGFALAAGVLLKLVHQSRNLPARIFDRVALVAAIAISLGMSALTEWAGLLQRTMLGIAYTWYGLQICSETAVDQGRRL
jgi:hypothetical protein